jgi:hypothetical protein
MNTCFLFGQVFQVISLKTHEKQINEKTKYKVNYNKTKRSKGCSTKEVDKIGYPRDSGISLGTSS